MPKPNMANIRSISVAPWLRAKLIEVPTNGAEQGVAINVANAPVKKL